MRSSRFVLAALLLATSLGASAQVTTFAGVLLSLENLKSALQSTIGTVDAETAARIRQAHIAIDQTIDNTRALGQVMYTRYVFLFQSAGAVLLVAMVGAIVLTLQHKPSVKRQDALRQSTRTRAQGTELVKVKSGQGL